MVVESILVFMVFGLFIFILEKKHGYKSDVFKKDSLILFIAAIIGIILFKYTGILGIPFIILAVIMVNLIAK